MLNTRMEKSEQEITVFLEGQLDTGTAPGLREELIPLLTPGIRQATLDMEKLDYISSSGIRVLLEAYGIMNRAEGTFRLVHVNETIRTVLDLLGLDMLLTD